MLNNTKYVVQESFDLFKEFSNGLSFKEMPYKITDSMVKNI